MPAAPTEKESSGFFGRLKARLNRGTTWLASELLWLGEQPLDEETVEELETRLLTADVGVEATTWLVDGMRAASKLKPGTPAVELLRSTALGLLETVEAPLTIDAARKPFVILAVGVNGTGKTTTVGKLAHRLKARGHTVLLAAADTFRAAAVEQLQEWGARAQVPVVAQEPGADPAAVVHDALVAARARNIDVVLADTAGRLHTAAGLMDELEKIRRVIQRFDATAPHETLLVLDASQGQNALAQALKFHEQLKLTGLAITKLDGTAKGGILFAIAQKLKVPIRLVGIGESVADLDDFRANEFLKALLGDARS
ncbi:MAG TPA: signal recognition particle-docking protein FtsY [Gammaproteobacteria bacterium]|nr:signal recognition particle-docking protein FtsY [Gammaproteobacteria bacterium]